MRVCVIGTRGFPDVQGGVEKHCEELYPRLAAMGCDITALARSRYMPAHLKKWRGVRYIHLWSPESRSLETVFHSLLAAVIAVFKRPDIVHIHNIGPGLVAPVIRAFGIKTVITYHSANYEHDKWGRLAKLFLRFSEKVSLLFGSRVIFVSRTRKARTCRGRKCLYIPNGITRPVRVPAGPVLKEYGLETGRYVLSVGRLTQEKGFHDLLDAFKGVPTDWKLVIAGGVDHEDKYGMYLKRKAGEDDRVVMTGMINGDRLAEVYSNAGLFVLPSYHEGLPIVLLEALSHGIRVLCSAIPANMEIVSGEEALFAPGDVPALRERILREVRRDRKSPDCPELIKEKLKEYDWDAIAVRTLELYRQL